tara:strand:- start:564 stop:1205 length:642 start_codon:yes stop_codon:yes gene_type:complete
MRILLIINKDKKYSTNVIKYLKSNFKNLKIIDHNNFKNNQKNNFDYVISYLSIKILNKKFIKKTKKYNINFHPGPSNYPGIGCFNFALYNNEKEYGVIAHIIEEKIDNGKIIKERKFKINQYYDVTKISEKSYKEMFILLKEVTKMIKHNYISFSGQKWTRKAYTRKELNKLSEIKINYSKKKILKILRCLYMPNKPGPFVNLKGVRFEYLEN